MGNWIDVTERLPILDRNVLVYTKKQEVCEAVYVNGGFFDTVGEYENYTRYVTHWMPMPEPPEMADEEIDRKVAQVQGMCTDWDTNYYTPQGEQYHPSTNGQQAMELLEKYKVAIFYDSGDWYAEIAKLYEDSFCADTPTRAICLAVLAAEGVSDE